MVLHQHSGSMVRIDLADVQDLVNDDVTRFQLVLTLYLGLGHIAGARNILIEIVGMSGADVGDVLASLSECGGIGRVGMNHALDVGEGLI